MYVVSPQQVLQRWDEISQVLRDAVCDPVDIDALDALAQSMHLNEDRRRMLGRLVRGTLLGFMHVEDFYKETKDTLSLDARLALELYQEIDKKIFAPVRRDIEENFLRHKLGVVESSQVSSPVPIIGQVVLRSQEPGTVDLKRDTITIPGAAPIRVVEERKPTPPVSPPAPAVSKPAEPLDQGPVILHRHETFQSVSETKPETRFKQMSFGGFSGAFKSVGPRKEDVVSRVTVEIPTAPGAPSSTIKPTPPSSPQAGQNIPVGIKQFGEQPKTVHYSTLKTDLSRPHVPSPPAAPQAGQMVQAEQALGPTSPADVKAKEGGNDVIDLSKMTFKK
jgi:hypothetical protein